MFTHDESEISIPLSKISNERSTHHRTLPTETVYSILFYSNGPEAEQA